MALLLIASAAEARLYVTVLDRPPYYRDEPIRIRVVTDNKGGLTMPSAENAAVERDGQEIYKVNPRQAGVVTVGPFIAGPETAPPLSFNVGSEISSSTEPDEILLPRLKREGHLPVVVRVDVVPAAPVEGQVYDVTWRAACDSCVAQLDSHDLKELHWRDEPIWRTWIPQPGIQRFDLYHAKLVAPRKALVTLPQMTFWGEVNMADGPRLVTRIVPPLTISIFPAPVPATVPIGDFELQAAASGDIPSAWHAVTVVASGQGRLDTSAAPDVDVPAGTVYTIRPYDELIILRGAKVGFSRQWTYDIHRSEALEPEFRLHTYRPKDHAKRDLVASAALPPPPPRSRRRGESAGLLPTIIFDAMLGATIILALANSRRS